MASWKQEANIQITEFKKTTQVSGLLKSVPIYILYPTEGSNKTLLIYVRNTKVNTNIPKLSEISNIYNLMRTSLSLIPSSERFGTVESSGCKKDYTYAEQYPVFISQEKLSKIIGYSGKASKLPQISSGSKGQKDFSPLPAVQSSNRKEAIEFHFSKFPSSSLNVELEKQCLLAELNQNIDKVKHKEKTFPPIKVIWKKDPLKTKEKVRTAKINMKSVIHGENLNLACNDCGNLRCVCRVTDSFCDKTWENVKHKYTNRTDIYHGVNRSKLHGRTSKFQSFQSESNHYATKIEQKRTRRRRPPYQTFENLPSEVLSISPKYIYMKVLEDDEHEYT